MDALSQIAAGAEQVASVAQACLRSRRGFFGRSHARTFVFWMFICLAHHARASCSWPSSASRSSRRTSSPAWWSTATSSCSSDMGEGVIGHGFKKHVPLLATLFFFILISNFVGSHPGLQDAHRLASPSRGRWLPSRSCTSSTGASRPRALGGYLKSFAPSGPAGSHGSHRVVPGAVLHGAARAHAGRPTLRQHVRRPYGARHLRAGSPACSSVPPSTARGCSPRLPSIALDRVSAVAMYALEVLVAFLQAYVFTILSAVYISLATSSH